jgi:hypothetical protein
VVQPWAQQQQQQQDTPAWRVRALQQAQQCRHAHTSVSRDPQYSTHNEDDVQFFSEVLGPRGVVQDAAALEPMNRCARARGVGHRRVPPASLWSLVPQQALSSSTHTPSPPA